MTDFESRLADLADRLVSARRFGEASAQNALGGALRSVEDCYAVQARVAAAVGPVGGFKTARKPGEPQIMAPILSKDVRPSPAVFRRDEMSLIGVELEIGFLVTAPLPAAEAADFADRARDCVALVPVLEIVDTRWSDLDGASALLRLADNQINGGLVVGTAQHDWRKLDLERVQARLSFGAQTVLEGRVAVPGGNAYVAFCGLARMVGAHCGGLLPGQVVITGSLNGLPFIERGTPVRGYIEGLGPVTADFPL